MRSQVKNENETNNSNLKFTCNLRNMLTIKKLYVFYLDGRYSTHDKRVSAGQLFNQLHLPNSLFIDFCKHFICNGLNVESKDFNYIKYLDDYSLTMELTSKIIDKLNEFINPEINSNSMSNLKIFNYEGSRITFENNGHVMVNATEMAKSFEAKPETWLRTEQSERLIKALSNSHKCALADLVQVKKGGNNPGTWMHEDVALIFAQWLSPDFYIWCNDRIKELMTTGKTSLTLPKDYLTALKELVATVEQKQIAENRVIELQPKAEVYDKISDCTNLLTVAKVGLTLGIGQKKFFAWLRDNNILTKKNLPYQEYIDSGYFEVKATPINNIDVNYMQTYFTAKGQLWIAKKFNANTKAA